MDALKYAHHTLIEKIAQKKSTDMHHQSAQLSQSPAQPPSLNQQPMSNVNEYCEKFEDSVRQNMSQVGFIICLTKYIQQYYVYDRNHGEYTKY